MQVTSTVAAKLVSLRAENGRGSRARGQRHLRVEASGGHPACCIVRPAPGPPGVTFALARQGCVDNGQVAQLARASD